MNPRDHRSDSLPHDHRRARRPQTTRRLRRAEERRIGGVAAGIADFVEADRSAVRWIFAISLMLTLGLSGVVYLLLWWLLPGPKDLRVDRSGPG